jgi:hypothetical protein
MGSVLSALSSDGSELPFPRGAPHVDRDAAAMLFISAVDRLNRIIPIASNAALGSNLARDMGANSKCPEN